ncbi:hypothetical protein CSHISOI_05455 [Colletotrichum shisoi]|uniref:EthD domain-containing protein n=1 Tax=Colletotrichum shisoi TaxID=2078593 RepID=A0A5Q4BU71_9PEZI|nr:hypothetical protein CSHISOI_05455 [Colletotrichum shisoi]
MTATLTVLYPNVAGAEYDFDYYIKSHMPLAAAKWKPSGCLSWTVAKYRPGPDGAPPRYAFAGLIRFSSLEAIHKALASPATLELMEDVPNYSNQELQFLMAEDAETTAA